MDAITELRFWEKVEKTDGCWNWTACVLKGYKGFTGGYGLFGIGGKSFLVHRLSWEINNGRIPDGLCVLHTCDNRKCVNPEHLFLGTRGDNARDMVLKGRNYSYYKDKTHCKRGHEFTPENIYRRSDGFRECRTCKREQNTIGQRVRRQRRSDGK